MLYRELVYEYRGMVMYRRSGDGLEWSHPVFVPRTGFWATDYQPCKPEQRIGHHPFVVPPAECLSGGPSGIHVQENWLYIFVGMGQNPRSIGCYKNPIREEVNESMFEQMIECEHNPLITGASEYGPLHEKGPDVNPFFGFRTLSSVEIQQIDERYYMLFEGVRGPGQNDPGDTQFVLVWHGLQPINSMGHGKLFRTIPFWSICQEISGLVTLIWLYSRAKRFFIPRSMGLRVAVWSWYGSNSLYLFHPVEFWSDWHNACWVHGLVTLVVVIFDVQEVDCFGDAGHLIELA